MPLYTYIHVENNDVWGLGYPPTYMIIVALSYSKKRKEIATGMLDLY